MPLITPPFDFRQKRKSRFENKTVKEKIPGWDRVDANTHLCKAGGHSNMTWFGISSGAPQRVQWWSHLNFRWVRFLVTVRWPDKICQIRCQILCSALTFQACAWSARILGSVHHFSSSGVSIFLTTPNSLTWRYRIPFWYIASRTHPYGRVSNV